MLMPFQDVRMSQGAMPDVTLTLTPRAFLQATVENVAKNFGLLRPESNPRVPTEQKLRRWQSPRLVAFALIEHFVSAVELATDSLLLGYCFEAGPTGLDGCVSVRYASRDCLGEFEPGEYREDRSEL